MGKVRIVCAWCQKLMRTEEWPGDDDGTSHGICPECVAKERVRTIRRNSKMVPEIMAKARNILVFSQSSHFSGRPLALNPVDPEAWPREVKHTTPQDFLSKEYKLYRFARLTRVGSKYTLRIHSNLWYEFEN